MIKRIEEWLYGPRWVIYGREVGQTRVRRMMTVQSREFRTKAAIEERLAVTDQFVPVAIVRT